MAYILPFTTLVERPHLGVGISALVVQVSPAARAMGAVFKIPHSIKIIKIQTKLLILAHFNRFIFTLSFLNLSFLANIDTELKLHIIFLLHT